jgi:hypothetical protein
MAEKKINKLLKDVDKMDPAEQKKLRDLLRSKGADAPPKDELGWMYKGDKPDSEEYLLGKRIDRYVDESVMAMEKPETAEAPAGALFSEEFLNKRADLDMQAKMREDPLFAIRKKEEDAKKRILSNPIKMKQLQQLVKEKEHEQEVKKKAEKKKSKKSKKKGSQSDDSDSDELLNKYLSIITQKQKRNDGTTGAKLAQSMLVSDSTKRHLDDKPHHSDKSNKRSYDVRDKSPRHYSEDHERDESRMKSSNRESDRYQDSSHKHKHRHSSSTEYRSRSDSRERHRTSSSRNENKPTAQELSSAQSSRDSNTSSWRGAKKRPKLSEEEMAIKRQEMMENAQWRDEQRDKNVKQYNRDEAKEEDELRKRQSQTSSSFVNSLMIKHANQSSVEERIKRNVYNIQRTNADLDKNFAKR